MAEFEERKKFWRIFYSPLVFIVLLAIFILMARAAWKIYNHEQASARERERIESELVVIKQRAAVLQSQVDILETARGVEDEIRSKFNVTKEGEGVAVIVSIGSTTDVAADPVEEKVWWEKFVGFLEL